AYLRKIHSIVTYLGISDGDMSQGSLRCDANVSVRLKGDEKLGTRAEVKNINSFRFVERAIKVEAQRQIDLLEDGGSVKQETRLYDSDKNETRSMRSKEEANDYRYFPCPDLLPVHIEQSFIDDLKAKLPELPDAKCQRFEDDFGLSKYDAALLTAERKTADYFETCTKLAGDAKLSANWINGELSAALNRDNIKLNDSPVTAAQLGGLILRIRDNSISGKIAKQVFEALWNKEGDDADAVIESKGLKQVSDTGALAAMVDEVLAANPEQVSQYQAADEARRKKMLGFFVGQLMKLSKGQANPGILNKLLNEKLNA
ncbi:MAG: Asp-tRNA(Asn)/Glu-tRNA(Gln) amidotransferase subunit GatB, partial [Spongiibacteraceae bacterium]